MTGKLVFLGFLLFLVVAEAMKGSGTPRQPSCGLNAEMGACPMNLDPVCGNDGNTYPNECALCFQRHETRADILIVKDGSCDSSQDIAE